MRNLFIPNAIYLKSIETLFTRNESFDVSGDDQIKVEFHPTCVAMHPIGLAFYAAISDNCRKNGVKIISDGINTNIHTIPYLKNMGLFRSLGIKIDTHFEKHEKSGRFIPLRKIKNSVEMEEFLKDIDPILHGDRTAVPVIKHVFSELLRNVIEHSKSPYGANVCATYNREKKKVSIGISDSGVGILNSLKRSHMVENSADALKLALTPGITGTTSKLGGNEQNAGAGLFFTKCIAKSTRNYMVLYSGKALYKLRATPAKEEVAFNSDPFVDQHTLNKNAPLFRGTLVGIDVQIDNSNVFRNLMASIGDAYTLNVRKSKRDYSRKINFT